MSISPKLSSRIGGLVFWLIFLFSGLAALIYQVCWQRLLGVYYGVGSVSVAIIVSIFMLGLGFGGLAGAFVSRRTKHVVFVYIVIEFLVAAFGLSSLHLLEEIGVRTAGSSYVYMLLFVSLFLIVPTVLMGATLPIAIAISEQRRRDLLGNVSFYYFVNTVGAAFGALLASYVMISIFNIDVAVKVAVAINLILAAAMYYVSLSPHESASVPVEPSTQIVKGVRRGNLLSVAALLFLNGFIAIGYQIIWFRIVAILLKDSIYTFSTMLFVYLLGIAVGSLALSYYSSRAERLPQFDLYLSLNIAIAVVSLVSLGLLYATIDIPPLGWIAESTHRYDVLPHLGDMGKWDGQLTLVYTLAVVVLWPLLLVLLPTIFMGAAFPVGLSLFADRADGSGSTVGVAYALTIAGNALGGLVTAFALLPNLGTTLVLAAFLTLQLSYVFLLGSTFAGRGLKFLSASAVVAVLIFTPDAANFYKKLHRDYPGFGMYFNEGVEGTVVSFEKDDQLRMFINGSNHGGRPGPGFVYETVTALSYADDPRRVLVVGFGTGTIVETLLLDERIESVTVVELNRTVIDNLERVPAINNFMNDPRVVYVFDDGRRYLERNKDKFDLVAMDPLRTRSAFSNNIYSEEFFELVRRNLNPDGTLLVWSDDASGVLAKTLSEVFDNVNRYSFFFVATTKESAPSRPVYEKLVAKTPETTIGAIRQLEGPVICDRETILQATKLVPTNRDSSPTLEYYLGLPWKNTASFDAAGCKKSE